MLDSLRSAEYLVDGGDPVAESDEEFKLIESSEWSTVELNKPGEGHDKPQLWHSHGKSVLPNMSNIWLDNPIHSTWNDESHVAENASFDSPVAWTSLATFATWILGWTWARVELNVATED